MDGLKFKLEKENFLHGIPKSCASCVFALAVSSATKKRVLVKGNAKVLEEKGGAVQTYPTYNIKPFWKALELIEKYDKLRGLRQADFEQAALSLYEEYKDSEFHLEK